MRRIKATVGSVDASLELLDWLAPKTAEALWASLPIEEELTHAAWAGAAAWFKSDKEPIAGHLVDRNEHPVTSIYPGTIVVRPHAGKAEMFISYGVAESRFSHGTTFATPVARTLGPASEFFNAIKATWTEGTSTIRLERLPSGE
jgi:hypothetical protein